MCLHPGGDTRIYWEAVLGTGSLKLSNLRENLKLLSDGGGGGDTTPRRSKDRKTNQHEEEEEGDLLVCASRS